MTKENNAKGILECVNINDKIDDDASLSAAIEDDDVLIKLVHEREHQDVIEVDIDDL